MTAISLPDLNLQYEPSMFAGSASLEQKNYNWGKLNSAFSSISSWLNGVQDGYELRISNLINSVEQPSEVVDARTNILGTQFSTLKLHLNNIEESKLDGVEVGEVTAPITLQIKGLTATSKNLHMTAVTPIENYSSNDEGFASTDVSRISLVKVG